jgi:DNA-binding response OmpR family regulator
MAEPTESTDELELQMKALVVEDDLKSQCLLAKVLAERGHEVTTFENAEQAILEYQKAFYPLLFVGVELPGMDGLQYCRWIRSQERGKGTYVIAAVDPNVPNEVQHVLEAGANDFLTKPYQLDQLRARLTIGERQMAQFFEQQQLEANLKSETHRWTLMEAALVKAQRDHEVVLAAKEAELAQLREELRAVSADREASRAECEDGKARVREAEKALEQAIGEANRLRQIGGESTSSLREVLQSREEELARLRTELTEVRKDLANRLRRHTDELIRLSEQMLVNIEDRKMVETELAAARDELVRRGREQVDESLKRADQLRMLSEERRRLECELERLQRDGAQRQIECGNNELEQRLAAETEEAVRLRAAVAQSTQRAALLEQEHQAAAEELRVHRDARKRLESRWRVMSRLGVQLNRAGTTEEVARVAGRATHELVGWDLFNLDRYLAEGDWVQSASCLEYVDGEMQKIGSGHTEPRPSSLMRRVLEDGPQIILQPGAPGAIPGPVVVDSRRRSVSLLCVPLVTLSGTIGFLTVRSAGENAYSMEDLAALEMVASHCAGALDRIELMSDRTDHGRAAEHGQSVIAVPAGH